MNILFTLVPVSLVLAGLALGSFLWSLRHGQYDDLEGDAARILLDETNPAADQTDHPDQRPRESPR